MNSHDFAKDLIDYLYNNNYIVSYNEEDTSTAIVRYLTVKHLQVISTKDQLLGYCSDDVAGYYESNVEYYKEKYPTASDKLTVEQSQDLLQWASNVNSKHDLGFCWDDIDEAITEWLKENY